MSNVLGDITVVMRTVTPRGVSHGDAIALGSVIADLRRERWEVGAITLQAGLGGVEYVVEFSLSWSVGTKVPYTGSVPDQLANTESDV